MRNLLCLAFVALIAGCSEPRTKEYFDANQDERADVIAGCQNEGRVDALGQSEDRECNAAIVSKQEQDRQERRDRRREAAESLYN